MRQIKFILQQVWNKHWLRITQSSLTRLRPHCYRLLQIVSKSSCYKTNLLEPFILIDEMEIIPAIPR